MRKGKIAKGLLAAFLILGIHANALMAEVCLCGRSCPHGLQYKSGAPGDSLFHPRCSGTSCKTCNIENGQSLKAAGAFSPPYHFKILDRMWITSFLVEYAPREIVLPHFTSFQYPAAFSLLPIYLKTRTLLI